MRLTLFLVAVAAFAGTPKVATDTAVVVFVDGHGTLPGSVWHQTEGLVSSIFGKINVSIQWHENEAPIGFSSERVIILLHFDPLSPGGTGKRSSPSHSTEAVAWSFPYDPVRPKIVVVTERVRFLSSHAQLFQPILAHTIAHEIAHILEVQDAHSTAGIMKQHWTAEDFKCMQDFTLAFTDTDVQWIQEGLAYRCRRHESSDD
jgi:hypothetical protein